MIAWGLSRRPDLVLALQTCTLAPEDKNRIDEICDQAFEYAQGNAGATIGTSIHHLADRVDRGEAVPDVGPYNITVDAYREVASHFTFHCIEQFVVCEELSTAGTPDRLCSPKGRMVAPDMTVYGPEDRLIWDLKTGGSVDYLEIKATVQLTPYALGRPYRHVAERSTGTRKKDIEVMGEYFDWPEGIAPSHKWGILCHVPAGEGIASLHWVPIEAAGVELAEHSNKTLWWRKQRLIVPAELPVIEKPDESSSVAPPSKEDVLEWLKGESLHEDDIDEIYGVAGPVWDDECTAAAEGAMQRIMSA
jgi:hypothetical protein